MKSFDHVMGIDTNVTEINGKQTIINIGKTFALIIC